MVFVTLLQSSDACNRLVRLDGARMAAEPRPQQRHFRHADGACAHPV
jgi:hypothetical protein